MATLVLAAALGFDPYMNEAPLGPEAGCMMHSMAYKFADMHPIAIVLPVPASAPPPEAHFPRPALAFYAYRGPAFTSLTGTRCI